MKKRIPALLLAAALLLSLCPAALAVSDTDCGAKLLAITFDDGPGQYTGLLLDGLAARGVKATFFVAGNNAANYPQTLQRIVNEGHQLASHTYHHYNLNTLGADSIRSEMSSTQSLITAAGGSESAYIRPPYGNANSTVKSVASVPLVYWSVDPEDWKYLNAATVENNIVCHSYDGAIILVHDIYSTSVNGALAAIDDLMAAGYEFVTVEQLLLRRGVTPQPGVMYYDAKNNGINLSAEQITPGYDESNIEDHWGYGALLICKENGYMDFENGWLPGRAVPRAEFVTALGRAAGIDETYCPEQAFSYADVPADDPALPYVLWARDTGLMIGVSDDRFDPKSTLTREQMATVVARLLVMRTDDIHMASLNIYADRAKIAPWAEEGVSICTGEGILIGTGSGFSPKGVLNRAEVATILCRLLNEAILP